MIKYIDAEKLKEEIEFAKSVYDNPKRIVHGVTDAFRQDGRAAMCKDILNKIDSLQQEQDIGEVSDGYHTFNELYYYRMLYNAAFFNLLPKEWVHKSKRHHTGEECFGGGWFIVIANLPTGQISNHYELKDWNLFQVPEKEFADEWDGHTPQEAAERLHKYLQQEQPKFKVGDTIHKIGENTIFPMTIERMHDGDYVCVTEHQQSFINIKFQDDYELVEQEQPEVDLNKFIDKIKIFQGRYEYPEIVLVKGAMAFMARMFYQYPNIARRWYDNLPKVTMD